MNWLTSGREVLGGVVLLAVNVALFMLLRPRDGLHERAIVRFPGAWIVVGLLLTISVVSSLALIAVGIGVLR